MGEINLDALDRQSARIRSGYGLTPDEQAEADRRAAARREEREQSRAAAAARSREAEKTNPDVAKMSDNEFSRHLAALGVHS